MAKLTLKQAEARIEKLEKKGARPKIAGYEKGKKDGVPYYATGLIYFTKKGRVIEEISK